MKKALISPNEPVATGLRIAEIADAEFEVANPLFWVSCGDEVNATDYFYNPESQICEVIPPYVPTAAENETKAKNILSDTDWTQLPSVSNPAESNPHLTNATEFATYRSTIRDIAINPVAGIIDWGTQPAAVWQSS